MQGGAGNDKLNGGPDFDRAIFTFSDAGVSADLALGRATGEGVDTLVSIEQLEGSGFGDTLSGDGRNNFLYGGGGNDVLDGRAGEDWLFGEEGVDVLRGEQARDYLNGGEDDDLLDGGGSGDGLWGDEGNDYLDGGAGSDDLDGGEHVDACVNGEHYVDCEQDRYERWGGCWSVPLSYVGGDGAGVMFLGQDGSKVFGTFDWAGAGTYDGKVDVVGTTMTIRWEGPDVGTGTVTVKLSPDGRSFSGSFQSSGETSTHPIAGTQIGC